MQKKILSYCCVLLNSVSMLFILFPFIKNHGFQSSSEKLLPFVRTFAESTNSLFLFISGCIIIFVSGLLYYYFVIRRFTDKSGFLEYQAFISLAACAILQFGLSPKAGVIVLIIHLAASIISNLMLSDQSGNSGTKLSAWIARLFYALFSVFLLYFLFPGTLSFIFKSSHSVTFILAPILFMVACLYEFFESKYKHVIEYLFDVIMILSIALFTIKNDPSYFDYSIIIGPLNDIIHGKDIGVNIVSTYGVMNLYVAAAFFKIFNVTDYYAGLSYLISFFYFSGYSICYLLLRYHSKNFIVSFLTITFLMNINFSYAPIPIHWLPQVGLFRFGVFIPVLIILYFGEFFRGKPWIELLMALTVAIFTLWLPELGVYILTSLAAVFLCRHMFCRLESRLPFFLKICFCILLILALNCLYIYAKYGQFPVWSDYTYFQKIFATYGIAMNQFTSIGIWIIPPLIYFSCIYICLVNFPRLKHPDAWLFLGFFGLQSMLYFVGKQGLSDLARVIIPAVILVAVGINYLLENRDSIKLFANQHILPMMCWAFLSISAALSWNACLNSSQNDIWLLSIADRIEQILETDNQSSLELLINSPEMVYRFKQDVRTIQSLVPPEESLAILSKSDTLFYVESQRKSLFKNSFYPHTFLISEIKEIADTILTSNCKYIFLDNSNFQIFNNRVSNHVYMPFDLLNGKYERVASLNFIDVFKRK